PLSRLLWRRPEDFGLLPDGASGSEEEASHRSEAAAHRRAELLAADVVWTRRQLMRTPAMWALIFVHGFSSMGVVSANIHLIPYVHELGYPVTVAAAAVASRGWVGLFVNPAIGYLIDRLPIRLIAASQFALAAVSMGMFAFAG